LPVKWEILIVDDHLVVREGLKRILASSGDCNVAAEAGDARAALAWLQQRSFDLVLLDISLPEQTGLDLLKTIKAQWPQLPVLMLTAYAEDHYAVRAFKEGADGYLNKQTAMESLITAIHKVAAGGKYVTPALAERIATEIGSGEDRALHEMLSEREFEIFKLIARGTSLKDIAGQLHISAKTVTTYRARILEKTGLASNAELTRYMIENDLLR